MTISITNAAEATQIFVVLLLVALAATFRRRRNADFFSNEVTQQLKGVAILAIVLSHIGYFLVSDRQFLFPLTIAAGVGVSMFLFLSGYGLTMSAMAKNLTVKQFYLRRLSKLYVPFWLACGLFFALDYFVLGKSYGSAYVLQSLAGLFTHADLYADINSPFWYFTFIVINYLIFPLVFNRKYPWFAAVFLYVAGYGLISWQPPLLVNVLHLYQVHIMAFPAGILFASLATTLNKNLIKISYDKIVSRAKTLDFLFNAINWLLLPLLVYLIGYFAYNSHVGDVFWKEEAFSLLTVGLLLALFLILKVENRLLYIFGFYSYEIYLLHWPVMNRYDFLYRHLPAWLATAAYLAFFIAASYILRYFAERMPDLRSYWAKVLKFSQGK